MKENLKVKQEHKIAKVVGNPKTHKKGNEMRLIINSRQLPTVKIAEYTVKKNYEKLLFFVAFL